MTESAEELRLACIKELKQRASDWRIKGNHHLADAYEKFAKDDLGA